MKFDPKEYQSFHDSTQRTCVGIHGFGLNPWLLREIYEKAEDYEQAIDMVLELEQRILDEIIEQEEREYLGENA